MANVKRCKKCKSEWIPSDLLQCSRCDSIEITPLVTTAAVKHDQGKPDLSIIPRAALNMMAQAFMYGASKYGRDNFRGGMEWSRLTSAAMRHITAWNEGEESDLESGCSHLSHALACLAMLAYYIENNKGVDNRPKVD